MNKFVVLKDIKHEKGIYYKEQQAIDIAMLILRVFTQRQAYFLVKNLKRNANK